jgi:hypothetical protein
LNGIMRGDAESLEKQSNLLLEYVKGGGGVILDTGDLPYGGEMKDIPDPFPVEETGIHEGSHFLLSQNISTTLTAELNLSKISDTQESTISYGVSFKEDSEVLVLAEDLPVVAYWDLGEGRVLWTGLRLPYFSNYYGLSQNINEEAREIYEERSKFLSEMINFVAEVSGENSAKISVEYPEPEKIVVHVEDASPEEAIWVKMSCFSGWTAEINDPKTGLRIFKAGPNMMLVFPNQNGSYDITFYFGKTLEVRVGEAVSLVSITAILGFFAYRLILKMKDKRQAQNKWDKTTHTGSGNNYVNAKSNRKHQQKQW